MRIPVKHLPFLYTFTAFLGASLIFMVEPLVARLLLPTFGGAATLWATANLFFQFILLGGYIFVHGTSRLPVKRQGLLLLILAVLSLTALPVAFQGELLPTLPPVARVLLALLLLIGLPFLVLSTTGPLMQRWYALSEGARNEDPYFIYAASNIGSFVGLLSYPFLLEPLLPLHFQGWLWSGAFVVFLLLFALCGMQALHSGKVLPPGRLFSSAVSWKRKVKWVFLAFIPSSLMLGLTTYLATDVGSFPLLWVMPLGIYLLTMILAFSRRKREVSKYLLFSTLAVTLVSIYVFWNHLLGMNAEGLVAAVALAAFLLLMVGYLCHALLAGDRPEAQDLTFFYVLVSLGGALGGLFNGFLAPVVFTRPLELFLVLFLVPLLCLGATRLEKVGGAVLLGLAFLGLVGSAYDPAVLLETRTFYGSYKVEEGVNEAGRKQHIFVSGSTIHGLQELEDPTVPTSYYSQGGPLGSLYSLKDFPQVAGVGLGVGTIAAYGQEGDHYTFFEIDERVKEVAENPAYFTYLRDSKATHEVLIGDGRLGVAALPDASQDLIVLDAFSSDSIPTHLLTQEAFRLYREKLAPGGVLAVHISNRFFNLAPVVQASADEWGVPLWESRRKEGNASASRWLVLAEDKVLQDDLAGAGWKHLTGASTTWTDDYAYLLGTFRLNG